ncbi:YjcZ family sporulation protein [Halalkalibacter lacteus]
MSYYGYNCGYGYGGPVDDTKSGYSYGTDFILILVLFILLIIIGVYFCS